MIPRDTTTATSTCSNRMMLAIFVVASLVDVSSTFSFSTLASLQQSSRNNPMQQPKSKLAPSSNSLIRPNKNKNQVQEVHLLSHSKPFILSMSTNNYDNNSISNNQNVNTIRNNTNSNKINGKSSKRNMNSLTEWAINNQFSISPSIQLSKSTSPKNYNNNNNNPTNDPMNPNANNNNNNNNIEEDENNYGVTFTHESFYDSSRSGTSILSVPKSFVFDSKEIYYQWMTEHKTFRTQKPNIQRLEVTKKTKQELIEPALDFIRINGNFNLYIYHFMLVVKLYEEWKKGKESQWYEWMQSLPRGNDDFQTGVNMDDIEISCLPPFALALANHEKEKLNLFYEAFQLIPVAFWDHLHDDEKMNTEGGDGVDGEYGGSSQQEVLPFFSKISDGIKKMNKNDGTSTANDNIDSRSTTDPAATNHLLNKDVFKWIFNVVHTRCWSYEDEGDDGSRPIIVPLGDMFNHKEPANVFVQDSSTSSVVEFIYSSEMSGDEEINISEAEKNQGLFLSYGLKNPHRFLIIFGFCDTTMPEVFSQLIFSNPSKEMIQMGCNDRAEMVYRTEDGSISNAIWDCVLYTLLNQVPEEQKEFYRAYATRDYPTLRKFHEKYLLEAALTLRPHVMNNIGEQRELLGRIDGIIEMVESTGQYISDVHPRLLMIRKHNDFLCNVFEMVRQQLDKIAEVEVKKRREQQEDPYQQTNGNSVTSISGSRGARNR